MYEQAAYQTLLEMSRPSPLKYLVVTPSVRLFPYAYFQNIQGRADHLVVEDGINVDRESLKNTPGVIYADENFITEYLGGIRNYNLIPSKNPSCKNFGLLYGSREKYDVIILLDDDCNTEFTPDFMDRIPIGKVVKAHDFYSFSGWFNPLEQIAKGRNLYARGFPYEFRGDQMSINISTTDISPVLNEGLWRRTPDINGVDKLWLTLSANGDNASVLWEIAQKVTPSPEYVFLQRGQHLPLSIMNVQLARRLVPAFWQPPDYSFGPGWRIRRHDDVWAMYFAKACIDSLGEVVTVGSPMIDHMKAGDMQREILSEHPTNIMQGYFTRLVDMAAEGLGSPHDYTAAALILSERMLHGIRTMYIPGHATGVLRDYATHAHAWANLFL